MIVLKDGVHIFVTWRRNYFSRWGLIPIVFKLGGARLVQTCIDCTLDDSCWRLGGIPCLLETVDIRINEYDNGFPLLL